MKNKAILLSFISFLFLFTSCSTEPTPIQFGKDQCHFCKMNIVDKVHAAQYVTQKGKQFKFDAIECMVDQINKMDQSTLAIMLVSDYGDLGKMTDALTATYLISENLKSPMGANLTGFKSKEKAEATQKEMSGKLFTWDELKKSRKK